MAAITERQSLTLTTSLSFLEHDPSTPQETTETTAPKTTQSPDPSPSQPRESSSSPVQSPTAPLPPHLSHDPLTNQKRSSPFQFGSRYLDESTSDPFEFNAWDHVTPDASHFAFCESQYAFQRSNPASDFDRQRINADPAKWWDTFYKQKAATFFKDRKWLKQEFPVLEEVTRRGAGEKVVLEVGAGAGNTAFPILRGNENEQLKVWACDFSKKAVETMRASEEYDSERMSAEVWDVASEELPNGLTHGSVDVVVMIFIFSALEPRQWQAGVENVWRLLKPGGVVLFRDYGRGDLAQVRFKQGRWLAENFYTRGDGTRVYFFEKEELERIWGGLYKQASKEVGEEKSHEAPEQVTEEATEGATIPAAYDSTVPQISSARFNILDLSVDRRLLINRQRRLKMYRCWIQGRFQKPLS